MGNVTQLSSTRGLDCSHSVASAEKSHIGGGAVAGNFLTAYVDILQSVWDCISANEYAQLEPRSWYNPRMWATCARP
jgi:hypothetical protein